jgi:hypothetical protein
MYIVVRNKGMLSSIPTPRGLAVVWICSLLELTVGKKVCVAAADQSVTRKDG